MLSVLITSKARVELLKLFVTHPDERYHYNELIRMLNLSPASIRNELKRLEKAGILTSKKEANIRFYQVNKKYLLYPELKSIIFKTVGLAEEIRNNLKKIGSINAAFIYGSVAKKIEDSKSDIDLMIIGDPDMDELTDAASRAETALSREINFTVFDLNEWRRCIGERAAFALDVYTGKKIFIIGNDDELRKITES